MVMACSLRLSLSSKQRCKFSCERESWARSPEATILWRWVQLTETLVMQHVKLITMMIKFIRYVNNNQFFQMQRKDADKRNEDTIALITQEWELVLTGKSADRLVEILQNYEMDLLANPIDKNPALFEKYVWALLAAGNYMDLKFLMKRTKEAKHKTLLVAIAEAGSAQNLKALCKGLTEYVNVIEEVQVKNKLAESTLNSVLGILSKYFLTYSSDEIISWLGCKEQDLQNLGYKVQAGYVELKREPGTSDCLLSKLKQLAIVANRMSKFE